MKKITRLVHVHPIEYEEENSKLMQKVKRELEVIGGKFDKERMLVLLNSLVKLASQNVTNRKAENIIPIYEEVTAIVQGRTDAD